MGDLTKLRRAWVALGCVLLVAGCDNDSAPSTADSGPDLDAGDAPRDASVPIPLRDDAAILPDPGGAAVVDVLANDPHARELLEATSTDASIAVSIDPDGRLRVDAADGHRGTTTVRYLAQLADGTVGEGRLEVYVDSYFQEIVTLLETGEVGERLLDVFDEDGVAPYDPGLVMLMRHGDRTILRRSWGPWRADTRHPIASATKWMAAMVALAVRDEGLISLDDPIERHLPSFVNPELDGEGPSRGDITFRQAFSMSHGLNTDHRYHTMRSLPGWTSVAAIRDGLPITEGCNTQFLCGPVPMRFVPGTMVGYDGKGFAPAGQVLVERYEGAYLDWESLARDKLLGPCGLEATTWDEFAPNPAVAGGVISTAEDYLKLLDMIHAGGRCDGATVLSAQSIEDLFAWHLTPTSGTPSETPIWESPWPNCSGLPWADGSGPADCSRWPDGTPTGGTFYEHGNDALRYGLGGWVFAETDGRPSWVVSPGAFGTAPFYDRARDVRGVLFTRVRSAIGAGYDSANPPPHVVVELYVFRKIREHLDRLLTDPDRDLAPTEDLP